MTPIDMQTLTRLGREFHSRLRHFFDAPLDGDATPLEIRQAVLDAVERRTQPLGRGRRLFPYSALHVRVLWPEARAADVAAVFDALDVRVRERLVEVRCEVPMDLEVEVTRIDAAPASWGSGQMFDVAYRPGITAPPAATSPAATAPTQLQLTVLKGTTNQVAYEFAETTVSIGRSSDPTDGDGRVRRNRVAFTDVENGVNETVGRAHARLRFDAGAGAYRLFDEGSRNGTSILRDGEVLLVHRRDPRGVCVRSGDEIRVGRALLRIDVPAPVVSEASPNTPAPSDV